MRATGAVFEGLALLAAACVVTGVALDTLGVAFNPPVIVLAALLLLAPLAVLSLRGRRRAGISWPAELAVVLVGAAVARQLLSAGGSALLPVGNSVDAVHHASLARYILLHGSLVRDVAAAIPRLGEMADYPPGFALLAAMLAALSGGDAHATVYPLAVAAVVLSACGISLLAAEGTTGLPRAPAAAAGLLVLLVPGYSLGIVAAENYYAQALAQCLIVACAYVAARDRHAPLQLAASKLGLLLLALLLVYTTWLPIALVAVGAGLLARDERPAARAITGALLLGGAAVLALLFGGARTSTGAAVVLHEGSTIRDPLGESGLLLPLLAAAGLPLGLPRRERWSGLGLIGGTLLLLLGFGVLWLRGDVAGYIFYKVFYLLAIVLPLPIGWLVAAGVERLGAWRPRLARAASALALLPAVAAVAWPVLLPSTTTATAHPLTPPLALAARWLEQHGAGETMYALRRPGLPAYWAHVGLLGNARDATAERLLREAPASLDEWYYDARAPRYLLLESDEAPPGLPGTSAPFHSGDVWVLEKTAAYAEAIARARPLLISFRVSAQDPGLALRLHSSGAARQPLGLQLAAVAGETTLATHSLQLPPGTDVDALELAFDSRSMSASASDAAALSSKIAPAEIATPYDVVLRLLYRQQVVAQRELAVCNGSCAVVAPGGWWRYSMPETTQDTPAPLQLGLGDAIDLIGASIEHTTLRPGDELRLGLRWHALVPVDRRYVAFVQLIAADGGAAASIEGEPGGGKAPTWRWRHGDTIDDQWRLPLPVDLAPGTYQLVVGAYDPSNGERLPAWRRAPYLERFWSGALPLGEIVVEP